MKKLKRFSMNSLKLFINIVMRILRSLDELGRYVSLKLGRHRNVLSVLDLVEIYISELSRKSSYIYESGVEKTFEIFTPNSMTRFRSDTFFTKEPEILVWIEEFGHHGDLWDVGANVGLYSIFFAKTHPTNNVYAFEPSPFNLKQLTKNIRVNYLVGQISVLPIALSNKTALQELSFGSDTEGDALNAFGVNYGDDGSQFSVHSSTTWLGFTGDFLLGSRVIPRVPALIKIDVDGIEHLILEGLTEILSSSDCKSVFIEANSKFVEQYESILAILSSRGFVKQSEVRSKLLQLSSGSSKNQIWVREGD